MYRNGLIPYGCYRVNLKKSVIAETDGTWAVKLGKIAPSGPFVMTITGKNTVTVNDV